MLTLGGFSSFYRGRCRIDFDAEGQDRPELGQANVEGVGDEHTPGPGQAARLRGLQIVTIFED
jgi:hypothetical protein